MLLPNLLFEVLSPLTMCNHNTVSPKTTVIFHIVVPDLLSLRSLCLLHLASGLAGQRARRGIGTLLIHLHTVSRHHDATAVCTFSDSTSAVFSCNMNM